LGGGVLGFAVRLRCAGRNGGEFREIEKKVCLSRRRKGGRMTGIKRRDGTVKVGRPEVGVVELESAEVERVSMGVQGGGKVGWQWDIFFPGVGH